jgi:hypothetical protein
MRCDGRQEVAKALPHYAGGNTMDGGSDEMPNRYEDEDLGRVYYITVSLIISAHPTNVSINLDDLILY